MVASLVTVAMVALVVAGICAPYETLGWWAGWYGDTPGPSGKLVLKDKTEPSSAGHFVVYLTGIGGTSPTEYSGLEQTFLKRLEAELPDAELVDDLFPYSPANRALTGQRVFGWFWRRLYGLRGRGGLSLIAFLINVRNLWQVLVSSDNRFGPLYNYATSELVFAHLLDHGYPFGAGVPVTLIGYSGGGQIATGAAPLLKQTLKAPVHVISLGGVMSSEEGLLELDSLTHLYGDRDGTQRLGAIFFPQRWPVMTHSPWNRARREGIVRRVRLGPMGHTGKNGYLDGAANLADGQSYLDKTVSVIADLVGRVPVKKASG